MSAKQRTKRQFVRAASLFVDAFQVFPTTIISFSLLSIPWTRSLIDRHLFMKLSSMYSTYKHEPILLTMAWLCMDEMYDSTYRIALLFKLPFFKNNIWVILRICQPLDNYRQQEHRLSYMYIYTVFVRVYHIQNHNPHDRD
jgi:hypothetical protein